MSQSKTCIVYCRTSTKGQKDAETIQAQVETCKRIVETQGLRVLPYGPKRDGWLLDDGVSGSLLTGRAFAGLVADLERGKVKPDLVVVYSLSRLAREDKSSDMSKQVQSAQDWGRIKAVLRAAHVMVLDSDGENDPNNVLFDLKTALAGEEYKLIRSRTLAGKKRMHAEGKFCKGGKAPFGFKLAYANGHDRKNGHLVVEHPEQAVDLRRVLGWYAEGGQHHAARMATQEHVPTGRYAETWSGPTVHHLVERAASYYTGTWSMNLDGKPVTVTYPKLIDSALYGKIERRKKEHKLTPAKQFLSTGFVDCCCGAHVGTMTGGPTHSPHYTGCRVCGRLYEREFSKALWDLALARYVQIAKMERKGVSKDAHALKLKMAQGKLDAVKADIAKLLDLYMEGLAKDLWKTRNDVLNDKRAAAQAEVEGIEQERTNAASKAVNKASVEQRVGGILRAARKGMTMEDMRKALSDLLNGERVTVAWPRADSKLRDYAKLTLPPWGSMPAATVRTDKDVFEQMGLDDRGVLDLAYGATVDDAVQDVGVAG